MKYTYSINKLDESIPVIETGTVRKSFAAIRVSPVAHFLGPFRGLSRPLLPSFLWTRSI